MRDIFADLSTKRDQLVFLQRAVESTSSVLALQHINIEGVQQIILDISLEDLDISIVDVKDFRDNLLEFLKEGDGAIAYLMSHLHDYQTRYLASSLLGWFGNRASVALPQLIDLASGHSSAAGAAQKAILFIGGAEQQILHAIEEALDLGDDESFLQLGILATKTTLISSEDYLEVLFRGARHKNPEIREAVADIVWRIQISNTKKVRSILELLSSDESESVREAAIDALANLSSTEHSEQWDNPNNAGGIPL